VRIVAMIQAYNEERFLANTIRHLSEQGLSTYVIDNESSDGTLRIAEEHLGRGVIGIETMSREGHYDQSRQCGRQEELGSELDADWVMHHDADEYRVSPRRGQTLAEAIGELDEAGYNAINFLEFTFVPTRESPDHDNENYLETLRTYYPFVPTFPHRLNAWKRQDSRVDLGSGHVVSFEGLRMAPTSLYLRHYLFLSRDQAVRKFVQRSYDPEETAYGWHGWRAKVRAEHVQLPSESQLRRYESDWLLEPSRPRRRHLLQESVESGARAQQPLRRLRRLVARPGRA
jgi:glycosyltransferase involved in cell wall biosynthesis